MRRSNRQRCLTSLDAMAMARMCQTSQVILYKPFLMLVQSSAIDELWNTLSRKGNIKKCSFFAPLSICSYFLPHIIEQVVTWRRWACYTCCATWILTSHTHTPCRVFVLWMFVAAIKRWDRVSLQRVASKVMTTHGGGVTKALCAVSLCLPMSANFSLMMGLSKREKGVWSNNR